MLRFTVFSLESWVKRSPKIDVIIWDLEAEPDHGYHFLNVEHETMAILRDVIDQGVRPASCFIQ